MQTVWKGVISFGLVSIPVRLFAATEEHGVSFRQIHVSDGGQESDRAPASTCSDGNGTTSPSARTIHGCTRAPVRCRSGQSCQVRPRG